MARLSLCCKTDVDTQMFIYEIVPSRTAVLGGKDKHKCSVSRSGGAGTLERQTFANIKNKWKIGLHGEQER